MRDDQWQLISRDTTDIFGIIRGDATWLSTVALPNFSSDPAAKVEYESCLFTKNDSEVIRRYKTKEEAMVGHIELSKKYNLK